MKLWQELAFIAKRIEKWILPTPMRIGDKRYFLTGGRIYSDLIFENDLTWTVLDKAYSNLDKEDKTEVTINLIETVSSWKEIGLEDINTYDAIWNVAWIQDTIHWIDISLLSDIKALIAKSWYYDLNYRYSTDWLLAVLHRDSWDLFIITWLQTIQKSLLD